MKPTLFYVSDAYCCWCYGFSPVMDRLLSDFRGALNVEVLSGRMVGANATIATFFGRFPDPLAIHDRVASLSGAKFGEPYLRHVADPLKSTLRMDSEIPAKAMIVFEELRPGSKPQAMKHIHDAYYQDAKDLLLLASYRPVCKELGVSFEAFSARMESAESEASLRREQRLVASLGVSGFPALVLQTSKEQLISIARGFAPYEQVAGDLSAILEAEEVAPTAGESEAQFCDPRFPGRC